MVSFTGKAKDKWNDVRETLCPSFKETGEVPGAKWEAHKKAQAQCNATVDRIKSISEAVMGEPDLFFVSEPKPDSPAPELWIFADDFAMAASIEAGKGFTIATFKPSRDFQTVKVTETVTTFKRVVVELTRSKHLSLYLHASGENCEALYDAIPYLLGHAAKPAA
jgi:hypothetical protein